MKLMKKHPLLGRVLLDLVCTGLALVVFALFHHVLPRQEQSLNISIPNPYSQSGTLGDDTVLLASAGISDAPLSAAKGRTRNQNQGQKGGSTSSQKGGSALTEETQLDEEAADTPMSEK